MPRVTKFTGLPVKREMADPDHADNCAARQAGLLKGQLSWVSGAFTPMTDTELADFYGVDKLGNRLAKKP